MRRSFPADGTLLCNVEINGNGRRLLSKCCNCFRTAALEWRPARASKVKGTVGDSESFHAQLVKPCRPREGKIIVLTSHLIRQRARTRTPGDGLCVSRESCAHQRTLAVLAATHHTTRSSRLACAGPKVLLCSPEARDKLLEQPRSLGTTRLASQQ